MTTYAQQRLAEIRSETAAKDREREVLSTIRDLKKTPTRDEVETISRSVTSVGYVYFLKSAGRVKIGFSTDVASRLSSIRTGCPVESRLVAAVPGTEDTETYFHRMFAAYRERGEWFRCEGLLAAMLRDMPSTITVPDRRARLRREEEQFEEIRL